MEPSAVMSGFLMIRRIPTLNSNRKLKYYSVEVITFDGESYTIEVEACRSSKCRHPHRLRKIPVPRQLRPLRIGRIVMQLFFVAKINL